MLAAQQPFDALSQSRWPAAGGGQDGDICCPRLIHMKLSHAQQRLRVGQPSGTGFHHPVVAAMFALDRNPPADIPGCWMEKQHGFQNPLQQNG